MPELLLGPSTFGALKTEDLTFTLQLHPDIHLQNLTVGIHKHLIVES